MTQLCDAQETCQRYTNGSKRRVHHIRLTVPCKQWNGEWCGDKIAGCQVGDACNLEKIQRLKQKGGESNRTEPS